MTFETFPKQAGVAGKL